MTAETEAQARERLAEQCLDSQGSALRTPRENVKLLLLWCMEAEAQRYAPLVGLAERIVAEQGPYLVTSRDEAPDWTCSACGGDVGDPARLGTDDHRRSEHDEGCLWLAALDALAKMETP